MVGCSKGWLLAGCLVNGCFICWLVGWLVNGYLVDLPFCSLGLDD